MIRVGTDLRLWLRQKIDGIDQGLERFQLPCCCRTEAHTTP